MHLVLKRLLGLSKRWCWKVVRTENGDTGYTQYNQWTGLEIGTIRSSVWIEQIEATHRDVTLFGQFRTHATRHDPVNGL